MDDFSEAEKAGINLVTRLLEIDYEEATSILSTVLLTYAEMSGRDLELMLSTATPAEQSMH